VNEDEFAELLESGAHPQGRSAGLARHPGEDIAALLADPTVWAEPDPSGADQLLAAIRHESRSVWGVPDDVGVARYRADVNGTRAPVPAAAGGGRNGQSRHPRGAHVRPAPPARSRRWSMVAVAAALALVLGVTGALVLNRGNGHSPGQQFALAGTQLSPAAKAWATVEAQPAGVSIKLDVKGLPPAKQGQYYEAWVGGAEGEVTVGTFHMRGGDGWIYLWSGVDPREYPNLNVTLEDEGPDQSWSGRVVLTGKIV
jgi:Anti-sigma-K factor rskA, C-terminal